jgi:hypothetical protein
MRYWESCKTLTMRGAGRNGEEHEQKRSYLRLDKKTG